MLLPSISHLPPNCGTMSEIWVPIREISCVPIEKNMSLPQTTRVSSRRKTAIGRGKLMSVLFLALSVS